MKVIIFGVGEGYLLQSDKLAQEYDIVALADNSEEKQKLMVHGLPVHPLKTVVEEYDYEGIVITTDSPINSEMRNELLNLGVPSDKIILQPRLKIHPFLIDPQFFALNSTSEEKKQLFANNIELVFLELSSKCNRRCWFCPNTYIDRHSEQILMSDEVFNKVLLELKEVNYDADISLTYFNEPLLNINMEDRIREIKRILPNAKVHFNTNGDYLTRERLESLEKSGLDRVLVTHYIDYAKDEWTYEGAVKAIESKAATLDLIPKFYTLPNNVTCLAAVKCGNLNVILHTQNMRTFGIDRGGALSDSELTKSESRWRLCYFPFSEVVIDYRGNIVVCSSFHTGVKAHQDFILGNVADDTIYDIFAGEKASKFRKALINDISTPPCNTCNLYFDTLVLNPANEDIRERPRYRR